MITLFPGLWLVLAGCRSDISLQEVQSRVAPRAALVDVGDVPLGEAFAFQVELLHLRGGEVAVLSVNVANLGDPWFAHDGELVVIPVDGVGALGFTYTPEAPGYHQALLTVVTDAGVDPTQHVTLRGRSLLPPVHTSPGVLDFGPVPVGGFATREITVQNDGTRAGQLSFLPVGAPFSVESAGGAVSAGGSLALTLGFRPTRLAPEGGALGLLFDGQAVGSVRLRGNDCEAGAPALYDADGDGVTACAGDCDDGDEAVWPGAAEAPNGVDDDCDGTIDEGTEAYDDDGDGFTERQGDCDDADPTTHPDATEALTDGFDRDCDGTILSGALDADRDGYSVEGGDCDDTDPLVRPGAPERANGLDDDCDGTIDEGTTRFDDDGDGLSEEQGDCDDADPLVKPGAAERANGADDDCDGLVDEGTVRADDDGDGYSEEGGDCDDANPAIHPGAVEIPGNAVDEDCDGQRP